MWKKTKKFHGYDKLKFRRVAASRREGGTVVENLGGIKQFGVMFYFLSCMLGIQYVIILLFNHFVYQKYFSVLFKKNPQAHLSIL